MLVRPINLALVDHFALIRKALRNYLSEQKNINVLLQAANLQSVLDKLGDEPVEIVLADVFLDDPNEREIIEMIRGEYPEIRILILSGCEDMDLICDLLDAGIHGYVSRNDEPEELLHAIRSAASGRIYRNRLFTEALYRNRQKMDAFKDLTREVLTDREKKIVQLIWEEKSSKEIADELFIGVRAIEKVRQDIKEKTGAKSMIGLMKYAIDNRIINVIAKRPGAVRLQ